MNEIYKHPPEAEEVSRSRAVAESTRFVRDVVAASGVIINNLAEVAATQVAREAANEQDASAQTASAGAAMRGAVNYNPNVAE